MGLRTEFALRKKMSKIKKTTSIIGIPFRPAELRIGVDWLVVYYARNPITGELERFRNRVPKIEGKKARTKYAQLMVENLNEKLYSGWSPFEELNGFEFKSYEYCIETYLKVAEKEVKDNVKRPSTLASAKKFLKYFLKYLKTQKTVTFISQIDIRIVNAFLDDAYMNRNASPNTYNSYLIKMRTFFNYCISKGYLRKNPTEGIKTKKISEKKRATLNDDEKLRLAKLREENFHFYVLCMTTYYCFIRPKELMMLRVGDVNLEKGYITVPGNVSKNKKTENVTIPNVFIDDLAAHIGDADKECYLFGQKWQPTMKVGTRLAYYWGKIKKKYNLRKEVQFYSLKDTGITDMLNAGVPAIKVRNQARHSNLKITEVYTSRNKFADEVVKNIQY